MTGGPGVTATYLMVDQDDMTTLLDSSADLLGAVAELEQDPEHDSIDIDTLWDALHFVLTGVTASEPLDDDPLSDAIVGVQLFFEDDDADFIAFTPNPDLPPIIAALKAIDLPARVRAFVPTSEQRVSSYPDGIFEGDREALLAALFVALESIIEFYVRAAETGKHVVVSIV